MLRTILTSVILYFVSQYICIGSEKLLPKRRHMICYNFLAVFCFYSFFNIFIYSSQISFLITITIVYIISLTMYYIHEFRGTNVNFSDILSINTAKEVAGGYKYEIKIRFIVIFLLIVIEYLIQIFIFKIKFNVITNKSDNIEIYKFFWYEVSQILLFFISFFLLKDKVSNSKFDYSLNAGENEGYIYNFISSIPIFHRKHAIDDISEIEAKDYTSTILNSSKENLNNINTKSAHDYATIFEGGLKDYGQLNNQSPHIIVIMNESFGSVHRRVNTNISVTPYFDSLSGVTKGNLYVNTFGGGTANTEFEFLTGMSIGNYRYPVMPYNNFVRCDKYSLAKYFNNLGYETIAMHPYTATNYHRDKVYKRFGFSKLLFFDDFKNKKYIRKFVSDESMYNEIIDRLNECISLSQKAFIFGITMQNHSGYNSFEGAKVLSRMTNIGGRDSLDSYLSLMKLSDEALQVIINYLDNINEHVVLLFFGDHNASFGTEINKQVYDEQLDYECTNPYLTPLLIYDNKERKDGYIEETSANFLSLELLKRANLPLDLLHEMLDDIYKKYSIYNFHKAKSRIDGKLYDIPFDKFMKLEMEYLK